MKADERSGDADERSIVMPRVEPLTWRESGPANDDLPLRNSSSTD